MEELYREHFELYELKKIFNDVCEMYYCNFRYANANRLKVLICKKYENVLKLVNELEYQLELDFEHIPRLIIPHNEHPKN